MTPYESMINRLVRTNLDYKERLTERLSKRETQVNERETIQGESKTKC